MNGSKWLKRAASNPAQFQKLFLFFSNSCNSGNFRTIYLKRSGFVMFALFSWCFGRWVCVHLLSFNIYLLSETFGDLWAGTLLFGCPFFLWYINGGTSVCTAITMCHFETVQLHLCVSFSVGGGRDLGHRLYGASVPVILSILFLGH